MTELQREYLENLKEEERKELSNNVEIISSFKNFMAQKGVYLKGENFHFYQKIGIVATYPNITNYLHPSLKQDKEGLIDFKTLKQNFGHQPFATGYLFAENFMLMANPYFRRGFHEMNNYSPRFIELFWNFKQENIDSYISLDSNRVRINVDNYTCMESDTWYGAKFNKKIEDISNGVVKLRPPIDIGSTLNLMFFNSAYSLDINWATKDNIKSFQAEEFKTDNVKILKNEIEYYPVRYLHAEYDIDRKCFRHFDGAIHFYTETEYYNRRDSDFNFNKKNHNHIKTLSQKLFKLNGTVGVDTWIEFSSHFLTGNPLVFEYFEGNYPKPVNEMLEKVRKSKIKL